MFMYGMLPLLCSYSVFREISQQVDSLKAIGGGGGGGSDTNTVLAAEGRMTQHLQELRYAFML